MVIIARKLLTRETLFKLHYNIDIDNFDQYFER